MALSTSVDNPMIFKGTQRILWWEFVYWELGGREHLALFPWYLDEDGTFLGDISLCFQMELHSARGFHTKFGTALTFDGSSTHQPFNQ